MPTLEQMTAPSGFIREFALGVHNAEFALGVHNA